MKKLTYLLLLSVFIFQGCKKEDVDVRDAYVGTWNYVTTGSMSLLYSGNTIYTIPTIKSGTMTLSKSGESDISLGGKIAQINSSKLTFDPETETTNSGSYTLQVTTNYTGTITDKLISITAKYSGTWTGNGSTGIISGSTNYTYTKQ